MYIKKMYYKSDWFCIHVDAYLWFVVLNLKTEQLITYNSNSNN